ncbi:MAG: 2-oxo acid dehydrogenase subunit E2 [Myxococcales bacterium]|nr:2-oxo acid dehydrogenase subunit E2 [Myxococcales bacterium]
MADVVEMIQLSPTMEEGRLVAWLKKEGDVVKTGDLLAEIETDKATMEMESYFDGTILKLLVPVGESAVVGKALAIIGKPGEDISSLLGGAPAAPKPAASTGGEASPVAPAPEHTAAAERTDGRILSSPVARRVAEEKGIDIRQVPGSGPAGRIIRRDVEGVAATGKPAPAAVARVMPSAAAAPVVPTPARAPAPAAAPTPVASSPDARGRVVPLSPMRKAIARNLAAAWQAPAFMLTRSIQMDAALSLRAQINDGLAATGSDVKVSVNDIIIKAVARALVDVPEMNSEYRADSILLYDSVDIGMAVAMDGGLITPIIRRAHEKPLVAIASEAKALAARAREKKLQPDEFTGATFSISNLGMFGIEHFTAVLNPPAAGILAVGATTKQVVVLPDGTYGTQQRMNVTLTVDHRAADGAVGATFLQKLVAYLEHPLLMMV